MKHHTAAVEEIEHMLQHSSDLQNLSAMQSDAADLSQRCGTQIAGTASLHLNRAHAGLQGVASAVEGVAATQLAFQVIDELCQDCAALIEHHAKIQLLGMIQSNLFRTLFDAENIAELPHDALAAEKLLTTNDHLFQAYRVLAALEGTANLAQHTLDGNDVLNQHELQKLQSYFSRVRAAMAQFEDRIFSLLHNFIEVGQDTPDVLTTIMQIVQIQEQVDENSQGLTSKGYLDRFKDAISHCIDRLFAEILNLASSAVESHSLPSAALEKILDMATNLCHQLVDIFDEISPCFPPAWEVFDIVMSAYHRSVSSLIDCFGALSPVLPNSDILQIVQWIRQYQETTSNLVSHSLLSRFDNESHSGFVHLVAQYAACTYDLLHAWAINILQVDMQTPPKLGEDGRFWSFGAVDFFQTINEQFGLIEPLHTEYLLHQTALALLAVIAEYQEAQSAYIKRGLPVDTLCAIVNNSSRCYDESTTFTEHLVSSLPHDLQNDETATNQSAAFLDLANEAVQSLVLSIFQDAALQEVLRQFGTEGWLTGAAMGSTLATLEDYLDEYTTYIQPAFSKRLAADASRTALAYYLAGLFTRMRTNSEQAVKTVDSDVRALQHFVARYAPSKHESIMQPLLDARELLFASDADDAADAFRSLSDSFPDLTVEMVEGAVMAQGGAAPNERQQLVNQCRAVSRKQPGDGAVEQKGASPATDVFEATVAALRPRLKPSRPPPERS